MTKTFLFRAICVVLLLLFGCAPGYKKISQYEAISPTAITTNDVTIECALQPWGHNRFKGKAAEKKLIALSVFVDNRSNDVVSLDLSSFKLKSNTSTLRAVPPEAAAEILKYGRAGYWFWSLFWVTIGTSSDVIPLPVGLVIGAAQFSKAGGSNDKMKKELVQIALDVPTVPAGETYEGLVFFQKVTNEFEALSFDIHREGKAVEQVTLPLGEELVNSIAQQNQRYRK